MLGFSFVEAEGGSGGEVRLSELCMGSFSGASGRPCFQPQEPKSLALHLTCHLTVDGFPFFLSITFVSGVQHNDSRVFFSLQIVFHYGLLQDTRYNSLWYAVNPVCLSILGMVACIC